MRAGTPQVLRALVADDHYLVREGLARTLRRLDKQAVVIEAGCVADAVAAYRASGPIDIVLLDLGMPDQKGLEALHEFQRHCPDARIVVVSASHDFETVRQAMSRGILGFIPKLSTKHPLEAALRFVLDGGIYVPPEAISIPHPAMDRQSAATPRSLGLTARQIQVMQELLEGKPNKQICQDLNLAMSTVKGHIRAIFTALGVSTRAEAILAASRLGWVQNGLH